MTHGAEAGRGRAVRGGRACSVRVLENIDRIVTGEGVKNLFRLLRCPVDFRCSRIDGWPERARAVSIEEVCDDVGLATVEHVEAEGSCGHPHTLGIL